MALHIDGKKMAAEVVAKVKTATAELIERTGVTPGIAVVIVGEDPASQVYVRSKGRMAKECGFKSLQHRCRRRQARRSCSPCSAELNADDTIHGILVQLPLPRHIDEGKIIQTIAPHKDVDGFHFINVGKLGTGETASAFVPCTPAGSMLLIERARGKGPLRPQCRGGRPLQHRRQADGEPAAAANAPSPSPIRAPGTCRRSRAPPTFWSPPSAGREMVKGDWVKPGAIRHRRRHQPDRRDGERTRLVGDADFASCEAVAGAITPVPGGVGPMTIAMLMANTLKGACIAAGVEPPSY